MFGVAEAERLARCQRNGDVPGGAVARGILGTPRLRVDASASRGDYAGQVDVLGDQRGHRVHSGTGMATMLDGGDQAEMS